MMSEVVYSCLGQGVRRAVRPHSVCERPHRTARALRDRSKRLRGRAFLYWALLCARAEARLCRVTEPGGLLRCAAPRPRRADTRTRSQARTGPPRRPGLGAPGGDTDATLATPDRTVTSVYTQEVCGTADTKFEKGIPGARRLAFVSAPLVTLYSRACTAAARHAICARSTSRGRRVVQP